MEKKHVDDIIVFTDGSHMKKTNIAGYGIYFPNKEHEDISRPFMKGKKTNQRAELYAIFVALAIIRKKFIFNNVTIYTDSEYCVKTLTIWYKKWEKNNWKKSDGKQVDNLDIIMPLVDMIKKSHNKINLIHVFSHQKDNSFTTIGNNKADELAKNGAKKENIIINRKNNIFNI